MEERKRRTRSSARDAPATAVPADGTARGLSEGVEGLAHPLRLMHALTRTHATQRLTCTPTDGRTGARTHARTGARAKQSSKLTNGDT